jgi:uncharacterized membrane protein
MRIAFIQDSMTAMYFYAAGGALLLVAIVLMWQTSPFAPADPDRYIELRKRRFVGHVIAIVAAFAFGLGAVTQLYAATR